MGDLIETTSKPPDAQRAGGIMVTGAVTPLLKVGGLDMLSVVRMVVLRMSCGTILVLQCSPRLGAGRIFGTIFGTHKNFRSCACLFSGAQATDLCRPVQHSGHLNGTVAMKRSHLYDEVRAPFVGQKVHNVGEEFGQDNVL